MQLVVAALVIDVFWPLFKETYIFSLNEINILVQIMINGETLWTGSVALFTVGLTG